MLERVELFFTTTLPGRMILSSVTAVVTVLIVFAIRAWLA